MGRIASVSSCGLPLLVCSVVTFSLSGQQSFRQTQTDEYTRYELLDPATQSFRIIYDVSATTAGARYYFNGIRRGSEPTVHAVYDMMSGAPLSWSLVDGSVARQRGMQNASENGQYIQVELARPVPAGGQARLRIDKTYRDTASYTHRGDEILFDRTLGIKRNSIVLPSGYELIGVNYPSQVIREADGRIMVSFMNRGPSGVPLQVRAKRFAQAAARQTAEPAGDIRAPEMSTVLTSAPTAARIDYDFTERAFQDRDIVYFLQQPETHSFRLYHDYTESRAGVDRYVNVVRTGSRATDPSAKILDTGQNLRVETLRGDAITRRGVEIDDVNPESEVVVIWFDPVSEGQSVRLRIEETYTDPGRYLLAGDELVWDRSFGRPRNTVVLPAGWAVVANSIPAVVNLTDDGRVRLRYENDRPGNIDVFIKAIRRAESRQTP